MLGWPSPIIWFRFSRWFRPRMMPSRLAFSRSTQRRSSASSAAERSSSPDIIVRILSGSQAMQKIIVRNDGFFGIERAAVELPGHRVRGADVLRMVLAGSAFAERRCVGIAAGGWGPTTAR